MDSGGVVPVAVLGRDGPTGDSRRGGLGEPARLGVVGGRGGEVRGEMGRGRRQGRGGGLGAEGGGGGGRPGCWRLGAHGRRLGPERRGVRAWNGAGRGGLSVGARWDGGSGGPRGHGYGPGVVRGGGGGRVGRVGGVGAGEGRGRIRAVGCTSAGGRGGRRRGGEGGLVARVVRRGRAAGGGHPEGGGDELEPVHLRGERLAFLHFLSVERFLEEGKKGEG